MRAFVTIDARDCSRFTPGSERPDENLSVHRHGVNYRVRQLHWTLVLHAVFHHAAGFELVGVAGLCPAVASHVGIAAR